jgi:flagellar basal-body rod protein FlgB
MRPHEGALDAATIMQRLSDGLNFQAQALALRSERQRLLASNIANADTPGYVARDLDFAAALREATGAAGGSGLGTATAARAALGTALRSLRAGLPALADQGAGLAEAHLRYAAPAQSNLDGNTVDMDRERAILRRQQREVRGHAAFHQRQVRTMLDAMKPPQPGLIVRRKEASLMSMFKIFDVSGSAVSAQSSGSTWWPPTLPTPTRWPAPTARPTRRARWCSRPRRWARAAPQACAWPGRRGQHPRRRVHDPKHPQPTPKGTSPTATSTRSRRWST